MSDDESEGEVPVCGSFEPQVWRKGYCRNCFHPGNKHQSGNILIEDDRKKFGKENFHKKAEKSVKDQQSAEKGKPLKPAGQGTGKSEKLSDKKTDKMLDKDKTASQSLKDKYEKLQKDKHKPEPSPTRKTGFEKIGDGKHTIPDKKDSSKAIPPPVLPKTKGKGLVQGDKLKSKSTSDIRDEIKSPVGNKLFKVPAQQDSLDKSKSKFGSAENVALPDKKTYGSSKQKFGSAENVSTEKTEKVLKVGKDIGKSDGQISDASKPDYKSLLAGKGSKVDSTKAVSEKETHSLNKDEKAKDKTSIQAMESKVKTGKETKDGDQGESKSIKVGVEESEKNKKGFPFKLNIKTNEESTSLKSPSLEKEKSDFKAKFEKPELKSSKKDDEMKDFKSKYEKSEIKSSKTDESEKKDFKTQYEKPELKSSKVDDKEKKDFKTKYDKPEVKTVEEKEKKDFKTKYDKPELKTAEEKEKKDYKTKYEKPELKLVEEKEKKDYKTKYEKPELKLVEEKEKKDYKSKYEKPELKLVEEKEKKDYKTKYEKPELKVVEEKEKKDYKSKYEKPELKLVEEKEKKDYKTKYEKPELKLVEEKEKKDFKAKYEKPELKSLKTDDKKKYDDKFKSKSDVGTKQTTLKASDEIKSKLKDASKALKEETGDKSDFSKRKWNPKSSLEGKDNIKDNLFKDDLKSKNDKISFKLTKTEEKDKSNKTSGRENLKEQSKEDGKFTLKSITSDKDVKTKYEKPELKPTKTDEKSQTKFAKAIEKPKENQSKLDEGKSSYEKPQLKSVKDDEKGKFKLKKDEDVKAGKTDLKSVPSKDNKFDFQKTLLENKKSKAQTDSEKESSGTNVKLDKPGLKSSKVDDPQKKDFKAKFERPQLKSGKSDEQKSDLKSKYEKPELKSSKKEKEEVKGQLSNADVLNENESKIKDTVKLSHDIHEKRGIEMNKDKSPSKHGESHVISINGSFELNEKDSLKQETQVNRENTTTDTKDINSVSPVNNAQHFDNLSSDAETGFDEPDSACAKISARSESPVHVDTQVFISSRNKTAGVESGDSDLLTTTPQKGFSGSQFSKKISKSPSREKSEEKETSKNESNSGDLEKKSNKNKVQEDRSTIDFDNDVEKLKRELLKIAEKCQLLEKENESLKDGLSAKESDEINLEKEKNEVESAILGLREQLKTMEDSCRRLESENSSLMTRLKKQEEASENHPATDETEEIQDSIQDSETICEDLMEENEDLKQEILDLKVEMEEMYDSFRDQEAEEFRELQKELEITAKNCRILQFKMRKAERRNELLEDDRNLFEDKLRILQNQFENKDAVSHIKTLEQELKMAKDVSVRLHDELDMNDDKRTKVEEENRHLTDLLEQADRKQFRLEIEVDKLRDNIVDLRQQLSTSGGSDDSSASPRKKINCAEFLAIHRDII